MIANKPSPKSDRRPRGTGRATAAGSGDRAATGRRSLWIFLLVAAPGLALLAPALGLRPTKVHLLAGSWCLLTGLLCLWQGWRGRHHRRLLAVYGAALLLAGTALLLLLIQPSG